MWCSSSSSYQTWRTNQRTRASIGSSRVGAKPNRWCFMMTSYVLSLEWAFFIVIVSCPPLRSSSSIRTPRTTPRFFLIPHHHHLPLQAASNQQIPESKPNPPPPPAIPIKIPIFSYCNQSSSLSSIDSVFFRTEKQFLNKNAIPSPRNHRLLRSHCSQQSPSRSSLSRRPWSMQSSWWMRLDEFEPVRVSLRWIWWVSIYARLRVGEEEVLLCYCHLGGWSFVCDYSSFRFGTFLILR